MRSEIQERVTIQVAMTKENQASAEVRNKLVTERIRLEEERLGLDRPCCAQFTYVERSYYESGSSLENDQRLWLRQSLIILTPGALTLMGTSN